MKPLNGTRYLVADEGNDANSLNTMLRAARTVSIMLGRRIRKRKITIATATLWRTHFAT
ncbi:MAG: hypothetical protein Pars93KO_27870 [Parasphingorhabdus sp.]